MPYVSSVHAQSLEMQTMGKMPVVRGLIGKAVGSVLRDTGCSGVVLKQQLVEPSQFLSKWGFMCMADNRVWRVRMATVTLDTPYYIGTVDALCPPDAVYDAIIGNISGAQAAEDPDSRWTEANVVTRAQAKQRDVSRPLVVSRPEQWKAIDCNEIARLQREDMSIQKYRFRTSPITKRDQEVIFQERDNVLYRVYTHPKVDKGKPIRQVIVPKPLRNQAMRIAHESVMGGHLGAKKTTQRILSDFYWPEIRGNVSRFYRSCEICQKTVSKGSVARAPLSRMPLIDQPFKRVAVDIVGPIQPPSNRGHRYLLTLVDYATRYLEAVPLKSISTEAVAEALVDIYSRLEVPEEILSDLGTQFTSNCMKEVACLLSINQLTTSPYHPACNGLVEKFNGTLKNMLKRLCVEQPRQWDRFVTSLLFAY